MNRNLRPISRLFLPSLAAALLLMLGACAPNKPATAVKAAFWPPYPDEPRLQYLVSYSQSTDVEPERSALDQLVYGKEPQKVLPVSKPYGVAMYQGKIYVCDLRGACVTILDLRNHRMLVMGKTGAETLLSPTAIAISPDGMKYVADIGRGMIYVYDAQDRLAGRIGHKDLKPAGVAVYQNELYVCDFQTQKVEVFDRMSGQLIRTFGEPGGEPGQFIRPLGIAVDAQGFVYVCDVMKCVIQKFDHEGKLVANLSGISANVGGLVRPKHIAVDPNGTIFVVDSAFQNVQLFDQIGRVYTFFGGTGDFPGAMFLPAGICIHEGDLDLFQKYYHPAFQPERLILVTNQFGDKKVSVYAYGHLKPGKTVADIAGSKDIVKLGVGENKGPLTSQPAPGTDDEAAPTTQPAGQ